jgi:hypothetical protein
MYASTPIPFLRRLHLLPDQAYFAGLSLNLPGWWAADPRFAPGFEFDAPLVSAVDEWADDPALPRADVVTVDQAISQALDAATPQDPVARLAEFSRRAEPAAPKPAVPVSDVLPKRFVRPVPAQTVARLDSTRRMKDMRRVKAAVSVTRTVRPQPAPSADTSSPVPLPPQPPARAQRVPSVSTSDDAHTPVQAMPAEPRREHNALDTEPSISQTPLDERVSPLSIPQVAAPGHVNVEDAIPVRSAVVSEPPATPAALVPSELPLLTDSRSAIEPPAPRGEASSTEVASRLVPDVTQSEPSDGQDAVITGEATLSEWSGRIEDATTVADPPAAVPPLVRRRARVEELPSDRVTPSTTDVREPTAPAAPNSRRPVPPSRRSSAPEPPRQRESDRLFQPVEDGVDRSPAVWAARLAQAMRSPASQSTRTPQSPRAADARAVAPRRLVRARMPGATSALTPPPPSAPVSRPSAPDASAADVSEIRVSETARRFLKPLVGIDPATVTILQGPAADDVNAAHQSDALAIGDDTIVVGQDFTGQLPRDLGLLAHELTHISRERRPRFVPPAARSRRAGVPTALSDEGVARRVEARTIALANDSAAQRAVADRTVPGTPQHSSPMTIDATPLDDSQIARATSSSTDWGGLPAPWEPLPEWLNEPVTGVEAEVQRSLTARAFPVAASLVPMSAAPIASGFQPAVHAADSARAVEASERAAAPAEGEGQAAVAPDIDQLARKVYAALKRRLEADARRERMFRG